MTTAILTTDDVREHITTDLSNDALTRLLEEAEGLVAARLGGTDDRTELLRAHGDLLMLARPAASITSIIECEGPNEVTLASDDYSLEPGGTLLRRIHSGTHPSYWWRGRNRVTYTPLAPAPTVSVVLDLIRLAMTERGLASQTIGTWSESYDDTPIEEQREAILAQLDSGQVVMF